MGKHVLQFASGLAAAMAAAGWAPQAMAFDTVNWVWDATVTTTVGTTATATTDIVPTGLGQVEGTQEMLGTIAAVSTVTAIDNALVSGLTGAAPVTDLVALESTATALGNAASLLSDVATNYDVTQTYGGVEVSLSAPLIGDLADLSVPGVIDATSSAIGVLNASVDNTATGVANSLTTSLVTTGDQDAFLIGDSAQTALAAITTLSTVDAVSFGGFADLGTLTAPAINSVATSVGNNLGVTIDGIN